MPGLHGQARSEGVVLHGTVDYIKTLLVERRSMIETLEAKGVAVDPEMKKYVFDSGLSKSSVWELSR